MQTFSLKAGYTDLYLLFHLSVSLQVMVNDSGSFFWLQAVALFKSYFGGAFDEDAIRNNFVLIYELLDGK